MDNLLSFDKITVTHNIRCSLVNSILSMMKTVNHESYVFGGYVRDFVAFKYANNSQLPQSDELRNLLCKKFSVCKKIDIDLAISELPRKQYKEMLKKIFEAINRVQISYNTERCEIQQNNSMYDLDDMSKVDTFIFECGNIEISIDIVNGLDEMDFNDFWANSLAISQNGQILLKPGSFVNLDNMVVQAQLTRVKRAIKNGIAEPHDCLMKIFSSELFYSFNNALYPSLIAFPKFIRALDRVDKIRSYGFVVPNITPYRVCVGATCCKSPKTVNYPKLCTGDKLYAVCLNCKKLYCKNLALNMFTNPKLKALTDCQIMFD